MDILHCGLLEWSYSTAHQSEEQLGIERGCSVAHVYVEWRTVLVLKSAFLLSSSVLKLANYWKLFFCKMLAKKIHFVYLKSYLSLHMENGCHCLLNSFDLKKEKQKENVDSQHDHIFPKEMPHRMVICFVVFSCKFVFCSSQRWLGAAKFITVQNCCINLYCQKMPFQFIFIVITVCFSNFS